MNSVTAEWIEAFREAFRRTSAEMLEGVQLIDIFDLGAPYLAIVIQQYGYQFATRFDTDDLDEMTPPGASRFDIAQDVVLGDVLGSQFLETRRSSLPSEDLYPDAIWSGPGPGIG